MDTDNDIEIIHACDIVIDAKGGTRRAVIIAGGAPDLGWLVNRMCRDLPSDLLHVAAPDKIIKGDTYEPAILIGDGVPRDHDLAGRFLGRYGARLVRAIEIDHRESDIFAPFDFCPPPSQRSPQRSGWPAPRVLISHDDDAAMAKAEAKRQRKAAARLARK